MKRKWLFKGLLPMMMGLVFLLAQTAQARPTRVLTLDFTNLEDLGAGWVYEGWLVVDGTPVSSGRFTVDGNGRLHPNRFSVDVDPRTTATFVLTIEPDPDPDPAPSATHVLAGDFSGRHATLTAAHPAALGNDFLGASGSYVLGVPSDTSGNTPYTNGIWWVDPTAGPGPSLNLPTLPAGWVYEGWVVGANGPISTGTFMAVDAADSDAGGPYAGPDATPPFPGQDFVNPPMSLVGGMSVISIEPYPDNSPAPYTFKPLLDTNVEDLGAPGLSQAMANNSGGFPVGLATLSQRR